MTECTRYDFQNIFGEARGRSIFITLRRYNLGKERMSRVSKHGNRYVKSQEGTIRSMIYFNLKECILLFEKKIKDYSTDPFRRVNIHILNCYEKIRKELILLEEESKIIFQKTLKGYSYIEVKKKDINEKFGTVSVCECCGKDIKVSGFYIAVLNSIYCHSCFNLWESRSEYHKEDREYEQAKINYCKEILKE